MSVGLMQTQCRIQIMKEGLKAIDKLYVKIEN